jgi:hypothetical protein
MSALASELSVMQSVRTAQMKSINGFASDECGRAARSKLADGCFVDGRRHVTKVLLNHIECPETRRAWCSAGTTWK